MSADLLARLIASGTPAELVAEVAMLAARAEASAQSDPVAARRREWDRQYRADRRAKEKAMSGGSGGSRVDNADKVDAAPSPDKSPPHPQKLTPTPCVQDTPPRESPPVVPILAQLSAAQLAIALVAAGLAELNRKRWKDMPPPAGVNSEQWQGFLDHRKAKREALTPRAYQLLSTKLGKHADAEWPPGRIVDHIVERGWSSFEPDWLRRKVDQRNAQRNYHDRPSGWAPRAGNAGLEPASLDD